jgi:hypothetical protein
MDVVDGFIAGIYSYCDRWCETLVHVALSRLCRCRRDGGGNDANLRAITEALPLPQDIPCAAAEMAAGVHRRAE